MSKPSPGPWEWVRRNGPIVDRNGYYVVGPFAERTDHWANARLIAAAPELLDALLTLMENAENVDGLGFNMFAVTKARRAISKATGETK